LHDLGLVLKLAGTKLLTRTHTRDPHGLPQPLPLPNKAKAKEGKSNLLSVIYYILMGNFSKTMSKLCEKRSKPTGTNTNYLYTK
jgi:hypothetical protein